MSKPRSVKDILEVANNAGWRIEKGNNHYKCFAPNKNDGIVTVSATPGDTRAIPRILSNFRKCGLVIS